MNISFDNFACAKNNDGKEPEYFVVMCKDREINTIDERWVVASLSMDEVKQLYDYIGKYIK